MIFRLIAAVLIILLLPSLAAAQENIDVAAATRSVVRVLVVELEGEEIAGLGHGSGVAVAPNLILTNAHVVGPAVEAGAIIGVVPSEGSESYEGKVIAFAPEVDLALIQLTEGRIPPATLYVGGVPDGAQVAALGYPYSVDAARELQLNQLIEPQAPVKSWGNVSAGSSSMRFDTVLHDAAIGRGNSGGPLVDGCGRVIGINSFLSVSEGIDAEFAFAVSMREVLPFLRRAEVKPQTTTAPCRTLIEQSRIERETAEADRARREAEAREAAQSEQAAATRRAAIRDEILAARDNRAALAAVLLVFGALALGAGGLLLTQKKERPAWISLAAGGLMLVGAAAAWLLRPSFDEVGERLAVEAKTAPPAKTAAAYDPVGQNLCRIDLERSRITVSDTADVSLTWAEGGCVNGRTQYGPANGVWRRVFVPDEEPTVTVQSFDPSTGRYTVERYLLSAAQMQAARRERSRFENKECTADAQALQSISAMQEAVRSVLPPAANERLVFQCRSVKP